MDKEFHLYFKVEFEFYIEASHGVWINNFIYILKNVDLIYRPLKMHRNNLIAPFMIKNDKLEVKANILILNI